MNSNTKRISILIVDDTEATIEIIKRNLLSRNYIVFSAFNVNEAIDILDSSPVDLVITDYKMPGQNGESLIKHVRHNYDNTEIIMITGYATVSGAVRAVKGGAEAYISKPFTDIELFTAIDSALEELFLKRAHNTKNIISNYPKGLIGESPVMETVYKYIMKAAQTTATALIFGESGTGKELVARAIHYTSSRRSGPFVTVNCGAIPENLLESELFGHVKGAFTGAITTRAGFFQSADRGTIFLDEIAETSISMQVKLLNVLQSKEFCLLGSTKRQTADVRIIAATNKDLMFLVKKGDFREDLYYRLNVITLDLPPLRDRGNDILLLINHFIKKYSSESEKPATVFSNEALKLLCSYNWPGNVRDLENVIRRMLVMTDGDKVNVSDLPPLLRSNLFKKERLNRTLEEVENEYIKKVFESVQQNKTRASKILGIDRKTLRKKLEKDN